MKIQIFSIMPIFDILFRIAPYVELSPLAKEMIGKAALRTAEMNLVAAIADLKNEYKKYRENAAKHPMYMKEWQIFYLRRLSDLLAGKYEFMKFLL